MYVISCLVYNKNTVFIELHPGSCRFWELAKPITVNLPYPCIRIMILMIDIIINGKLYIS